MLWIKNKRWHLLVAFCIGAIAAGLGLWLTQPEPTFFARTGHGMVQGIKVEGVNSFLGIPYAAPPVGDLRWTAPRFPKKWKTIFKADTVPPHCVQSIFGMERGQEDCLYLNVWTPSLFPPDPLPVMVWIHGGGFTVGHSYETTPGQRLAKDGNVVVVSINYRLGALGFMAHPALTQESQGSSGNYGMLDQIHALRWVQNNIRHFGGDPDNITIFGESAGGMSVCNLLASPLARDLFDKAVIQSGPCFSPYPPLATMEQQGLKLQKAAACDSAADPLACLRSKSASEILAAMPPDPGMVFGEEEYWMPNVDGEVFLEQPFQSMRAGRIAKVPVINGNNADEGSLLVMFGHEYQFKKLTPEKYPDRIHYLVRDEEKVKRVLERYPLENYSDPGAALADVFGDQSFACHQQWTSDALAQYVPVYSYYFSYPDADFVLPELRSLGAFHSAEVQYLFAEPMGWLWPRFYGEEAELSRRMIQYWSQFARSGNPNRPSDKQGDSAYNWPEYGISGQRLQIDNNLSLKAAKDEAETCDFWRALAPEAFPAGTQ